MICTGHTERSAQRLPAGDMGSLDRNILAADEQEYHAVLRVCPGARKDAGGIFVNIIGESTAAEYSDILPHFLQLIAKQRHGHSPDGHQHLHCLDPRALHDLRQQIARHLRCGLVAQLVLKDLDLGGGELTDSADNGNVLSAELALADITICGTPHDEGVGDHFVDLRLDVLQKRLVKDFRQHLKYDSRMNACILPLPDLHQLPAQAFLIFIVKLKLSHLLCLLEVICKFIIPQFMLQVNKISVNKVAFQCSLYKIKQTLLLVYFSGILW